MGISSINIPVTPAVPLSNAAPLTVAATTAAGTGVLGSREDHSHALADTGWLTPMLLNGWIQYHADWGAARYRRIAGVVFLSGLVKDGTLGADLFVLPAGYRPAHNKLFSIERDPNIGGRIDVFPDGRVIMGVVSAGWTSLSDVIFPADA